MSRKLLLIFIVLIPMLSCRSSGSDSGTSLASLDRDVREKLPIGTARERVIQFLKARKITVQDSRDVRYYKGPSKVWGLVPDANKQTVIKADATLTFEFDDKGLLTSYRMSKRLVGP